MSSEEHIKRHVIVHGEVQGVFFRDVTRERAQLHGVAGWVRNNPDGSVEAVFEGDPQAVEEMLDFCHQGPDRAEVERVDVNDSTPDGLSGFEVR
jgi:acylphosphatase